MFTLFSSSVIPAGEGKPVRDGIKQIHKGLEKITRAVDKKAKKGFKTIHKKAKKDVKTIDKNAKQGWKKAGKDIGRAIGN